jgi:hypothetical protein
MKRLFWWLLGFLTLNGDLCPLWRIDGPPGQRQVGQPFERTVRSRADLPRCPWCGNIIESGTPLVDLEQRVSTLFPSRNGVGTLHADCAKEFDGVS